MIRSCSAALAIPVVEAAGFEADDVLATLATEARDRGQTSSSSPGTATAFQLVEDPYVRVLYNRRGVSDYSLYDEAGIIERTGVPPGAVRAAGRAAGRPVGQPARRARGGGEDGGQAGQRVRRPRRDLRPPRRADAQAAREPGRARGPGPDERRGHPARSATCRSTSTSTSCTLGGWDPSERRSRLRRVRAEDALAPVLDADGRGRLRARRPAGRPSPPSTRRPGATDGRPAAAGRTTSPAWLAAPEVVVPTDAAGRGGRADRRAGRRRPCGDREPWPSTPGGPATRADRPLAWPLAAEPPEAGPGRHLTPCTSVAGRRCRRPARRIRRCSTALADGARSRRGRWSAHDVKELMRSLLPLGVDITGAGHGHRRGRLPARPLHRPVPPGRSGRQHLGVAVDDGVGGRARAPSSWPTPADGGDAARPSSTADGCRGGAAGRRCWPGCAPRCTRPCRVGEPTLLRRHRDPLVRVLARMEVAGIRVDREVLRSIAAGLADECRSLEATMHELAGEPVQRELGPAAAHGALRRLGLTPGRKTKTGFSTDAQTLESCGASTRSSRRCSATGRWRSCARPTARAWPPRWPPTGASTPPSARRWPAPGGSRRTGPTCTTSRCAPSRAGSSAGPSCRRPGRRLLVADYDQVELRAIAHLSGDPGLIAAFDAGEDIHRTVAARVFGVDRRRGDARPSARRPRWSPTAWPTAWRPTA